MTRPTQRLDPDLLVLRPPGPRDDDAVAQLEAAGLPEVLRADPALAPLLAIQARARRASIAAAFPEARTRLVECDSRPVALLVTDHGPDSLHVVDIAVAPDCRRKGVAAALLAMLGAEAGGLPLTARIYPDNGPSLALFAAAGFRLEHADGAAQVTARSNNTVIDS